MSKDKRSCNIWRRIFGKWIGPGVITGAADDDPSGIATYTQSGAQFGYGQLWTVILMLPFMTAIQEACARIGAVTGKGLAAVVKDRYGKIIVYLVVGLVLLANTINIGADIGAVAAAAQLLVPVPFAFLAIGFTIAILLLEIFTSYRQYAKILKWFCLSLLAYVITVFMVQQPWGELLRATFVPHWEWTFPFLMIVVGVFGTTISPYMFFWQASEEVEEEREQHIICHSRPKRFAGFMKRLRVDNFVGMLFSEIATWSIIVVGATVLHANGLTDVKTAAEAARALEPLVQTFPHAGFLAKVIFAVGIIGLGVLGISVLAGSASYALSEVFNWRAGLNFKPRRAIGFYTVMIVATVIGLAMNLIGVNPIKALVYAAVFNGVAAVPLIFVIAKVARDAKIMGQWRSGWFSSALVWLTFLIMGLAAVAMFYTWGQSWL